MSDTNEDCEILGIFPDISKAYQSWINTDVSELMLENKSNTDPSTEDNNEVDTRHTKRRRYLSTLGEDPDDDIILVEDDPLLETATVASSRPRIRSRGRRGESVILIDDDSQPETTTVASRRGRGCARGRRGSKRGRGRGNRAGPTLTNEVPLVVNDSDDDESTGDLNTSLGSDDFSNYEMSVKVTWKSKDIHRFKIRKYQMMKTIFKFFSDLEGVPEHKLLFVLNDKQIQPDDTPDSLQLSVVDFIDGGITTMNTSPEVKRKEHQLKEGELELKILCKDRKKPLTIPVHKEEKLETLRMKVAEILELPQEKLKFIFDGEPLDLNDTPTDLDLEGGECIDVNIVA